jgi:hypothetical protein
MNPPRREVVRLSPFDSDPTGASRDPHRRWWIWAMYLLLFGASIPWYFPAGRPPRIWLGLPDWVLVSWLATLGVALFTALVVRRFWPQEETSPPPGSASEDQEN